MFDCNSFILKSLESNEIEYISELNNYIININTETFLKIDGLSVKTDKSWITSIKEDISKLPNSKLIKNNCKLKLNTLHTYLNNKIIIKLDSSEYGNKNNCLDYIRNIYNNNKYVSLNNEPN